MNKTLTAFLFLLLMSIEASGKAVSDLSCVVVALHRECSGCSLKGAKGVLEVVENRARIDKKSLCKVVRSSAFPWSRKQHSWKFTEEMLTRYFEVRMIEPVVGKMAYYFNTTRMPYGTYCCKVEDHYFYYRN